MVVTNIKRNDCRLIYSDITILKKGGRHKLFRFNLVTSVVPPKKSWSKTCNTGKLHNQLRIRIRYITENTGQKHMLQMSFVLKKVILVHLSSKRGRLASLKSSSRILTHGLNPGSEELSRLCLRQLLYIYPGYSFTLDLMYGLSRSMVFRSSYQFPDL